MELDSPCRVCGAGAPRGGLCANHKGYAQCGVCLSWAFSHNPTRANIYCSDDCRIEAGVLPNGTYVGTSCPLEWGTCPCGELFYRPGKKFCSDGCESKSKQRTCPDCPAPLAKNRQRCDDCRAIREAARKSEARKKRPKRNHYRKRAQHHGVPYEPVNRRKVYERDNWICGICNEPVDKTLKYPDVMSVSLDHIIPMARGGPHSYENTQCAHFICNSIKSDRLEFVS